MSEDDIFKPKHSIEESDIVEEDVKEDITQESDIVEEDVIQEDVTQESDIVEEDVKEDVTQESDIVEEDVEEDVTQESDIVEEDVKEDVTEENIETDSVICDDHPVTLTSEEFDVQISLLESSFSVKTEVQAPIIIEPILETQTAERIYKRSELPELPVISMTEYECYKPLIGDFVLGLDLSKGELVLCTVVGSCDDKLKLNYFKNTNTDVTKSGTWWSGSPSSCWVADDLVYMRVEASDIHSQPDTDIVHITGRAMDAYLKYYDALAVIQGSGKSL